MIKRLDMLVLRWTYYSQEFCLEFVPYHVSVVSVHSYNAMCRNSDIYIRVVQEGERYRNALIHI